MMRKSVGSFLALTLAASLCFAVWSCGNSNNGAPSATIKLKTFQAASVVIGQPDFTHNSPNQGGNSTANTIYAPYGNAFVDSVGTLFVPDQLNNRELGFNKIPTVNDANADFVLGQSSFTTSAHSNAADGMYDPETAVVYKGKLLVADWANKRVLIWNSVPKSNGAPADVVVGQTGFNASGSACSASGMDGPASIAVTPGGKLIVADYYNNRVLIFNQIPTASGASANLVLGQTDFTTCVSNNNGTGATGSPSASSLNNPSGVWSNGKKLVVVDNLNQRVLIWNKFPTSNFQKADVVLGQADFTCGVANNDGTGSCASGSPSASNMDSPWGVYSNGTQLFIADGQDNRVLIWNKFPTKNFQPANVVLGQPDFTCGAANNDGTGTCTAGSTSSAQGLRGPSGMFQSGNRLIVTDEQNNRYLIFKGK